MSKNILREYVEKQRIIEYLDECRPVLTDWRKDNGEGLTLQEIRYNAACNVYDEIRDMIENPRNVADVTPVVHCLDCQYFYPFFDPPYGKCSRRHCDNEVVKTTDFCSYANIKTKSEDKP